MTVLIDKAKKIIVYCPPTKKIRVGRKKKYFNYFYFFFIFINLELVCNNERNKYFHSL